MAKTLHFDSQADYQRWLAFGQMHGKFRHHGGKGTPVIKIAGKTHRVKHGRKNPAELVVFANPRKRKGNATHMRVGGVVGKVIDTRGTVGQPEYLLETKDGKQVWVKPRYAPRTNNGKRKPNPHREGCNCAICKNARGETHSPGCGCAVCNRNRHGRAKKNGLKNPSVIINRANPRREKLRRRRRNSNDANEAVRLYQTFHGKDPSGVIEKQVSAAMRMEYTALGDLEYLIVEPPGKPVVKIDCEGDRVKLASSADGAQLYLIGGNQNVTDMLGKFTDDASKDFIELGTAIEVQYFAHKAVGNFQPVSYYHKFGEESGVAPVAMFDRLKKQIFLIGGEYRIEAPGIVN